MNYSFKHLILNTNAHIFFFPNFIFSSPKIELAKSGVPDELDHLSPPNHIKNRRLERDFPLTRPPLTF